MKKLLTLLMVALVAFTLVGCGSESADNTTNSSNGAQVAVVTDVGILMDGGFNQGTWEGAVEFCEENNMTYAYYQPANGNDATDDDRIAAMRLAIENGAKVIVTPGFLQAAAIETVAAESPEVKFVFVDGWALGLDNVTAITFHEEESGYFAGYAAVKDGYTKLGATFGGAGTNAACNRYAFGFIQGMNQAAADLGTTVDATVSFLYGNSFSASTELQTQIASWYNAGTQVVFSCGGSMLQSVKAAASESAEGKIIGVDTDQVNESDRVITSAMKGLTPAVKLVLTEWNAGEWDGKLANQTSNLGVNDNATGLPTAETSWKFNTFTVEEYEAVRASVANGEVAISTDCDNLTTADAFDAIKAACANVNLTIEG